MQSRELTEGLRPLGTGHELCTVFLLADCSCEEVLDMDGVWVLEDGSSRFVASAWTRWRSCSSWSSTSFCLIRKSRSPGSCLAEFMVGRYVGSFCWNEELLVFLSLVLFCPDDSSLS